MVCCEHYAPLHSGYKNARCLPPSHRISTKSRGVQHYCQDVSLSLQSVTAIDDSDLDGVCEKDGIDDCLTTTPPALCTSSWAKPSGKKHCPILSFLLFHTDLSFHRGVMPCTIRFERADIGQGPSSPAGWSWECVKATRELLRNNRQLATQHIGAVVCTLECQLSVAVTGYVCFERDFFC